MDEPGFFSNSRVLIVGLGLMGGSLALALHGKTAWLGGVDPSSEGLELASKLNIFDALSANMLDLLPLSNVIILAAPVRENIKIIQSLPGGGTGHIILDLSSTKSQVVEALNLLPPTYDPIGGHPMCGSEKSSIRFARPDLFNGATFILTPLERTSANAVSFLIDLIKQVGAVPLRLTAEIHDQMAAETSHFPYIIASALSLATHLESKPLISSGFRSTARIAGSSPQMMLDILLSNRENVLAMLASMNVILQSYQSALMENDEKRLSQLIRESQQKYYRLVD